MPIYQHDLPRPPRVRKPSVVEVAQFGGLNLRDDPQEIGWQGAIDLLNVERDQLGRLRQRNGHTLFSDSGDPLSVHAAHQSAGTDYLLTYTTTGSGGTTQILLTRVDVAGTKTAYTAWTVGLWAQPTAVVQFGTPTSELTFIASAAFGGNNATLRKFDGSSVAKSTGDPRFVAVTPIDNRLVQAGFTAAAGSPTGANGSRSTVFFSDAGAPETYGANNYVHLTPGDGEQILAMATWGTYLFVFKESKFFVFYGTSTDGSGNPVFEYRRVDLASPLSDEDYADNSLHRLAVAGESGLYFATRDGIYQTTGGGPQRISGPVDPIFRQEALPHFNDVGRLTGLSFADDRLFASYAHTNNSAESMLVWNPRTDIWLRWRLHGTSVVPWNGTLYHSSHLLGGTYATSPAANSNAATTDAGTAIDSRYVTGFSDLGSPGIEKILRELRIDGTGTIGVSAAINDSATTDTAATITLGTSPAVAQGRHRYSRRARNIAVRFDDVSGAPWSVYRFLAEFQGERPPGIGVG